jgi:hypothetical protein
MHRIFAPAARWWAKMQPSSVSEPWTGRIQFSLLFLALLLVVAAAVTGLSRLF